MRPRFVLIITAALLCLTAYSAWSGGMVRAAASSTTAHALSGSPANPAGDEITMLGLTGQIASAQGGAGAERIDQWASDLARLAANLDGAKVIGQR
jgi:hypothetical protein